MPIFASNAHIRAFIEGRLFLQKAEKKEMVIGLWPIVNYQLKATQTAVTPQISPPTEQIAYLA